MINIQHIDDNECYKWSIVRILNPANHEPARSKKLDFKDIRIRGKIRDVHKIEEKNSIRISVFGYENIEKQPIYVSKQCCEEKHVDVLSIGEEGKGHYVLIKYFNTSMYDHTSHHGKKHFCHYFLQALFSAEEILKCHIKDCFKINGKQRLTMPKEGKYVKFKHYERKIKSPLIIYAEFGNILVPRNNGKQIPEEIYANKYQKHITCSYGYKLVCVDDKFDKPFKTYLDEETIYNSITILLIV